MTRSISRRLPLLVAATLAACLAACEDQLPTSVDEDLLPVGPVSIEVRLPWSQFATTARVFSGFGRPEDLGVGIVGNAYEGTLDVNTLVRFDAFPRTATVPDSLGTSVPDTLLSYTGGTVVLHFDPDASTNTGPVLLRIARTLSHWDVHTATWQLAVDSVGTQLPWPEPGGGPVEPLTQGGTAVEHGFLLWDKSLDGDSALLVIDSVAVAGLIDTTSERGLRLSMVTPGEQVVVTGISLDLIVRPSVHQDTLVTLPRQNISQATFIYNPPPPAPQGLRVGGVPTSRSVLTLALPATVPGTPEACARVTCPIALTPERINYAGLVLRSTETATGYRPVDSVTVQAVAVLAPETLPKSPIGPGIFHNASGFTLGSRIDPGAFAPGGARGVEVGITPLVEDLLRGQTSSGGRASPTIALLSLGCSEETGLCKEVESIGFGEFAGVGQPGEPMLRLILTVSQQVELP